ncbi:hypothetical protein WH52_13755 [Tenacibaculum holothuriorum]|uniref:Uncharacterized protein n=1 Tax=Tenacibaculum holothuriorum TaxID=1635173 RepID=A0A1Y2P9V4_9FLAO|nr:hypothetical protein [Tenacibaculum holothuriorum]OSY86960.1 hypothetical protein WH52_13755 [Tenacibaculum holothuriorum]
MKKTSFLLILLLLINCSRPLYIKDKHFNCSSNEFIIDSDLKELVYKSLKRAVVTQKDIPDYRLLWKKHRIYVASEYHDTKKHYPTISDWKKDAKNLKPNEVPNSINNVSFCLKTQKELQKIANKTWENFLHLSFKLIKIEENKATIKINNTWIVSNKHPKTSYLSGGGYVLLFKKSNNNWEFEKIEAAWIS